MQLPTTALADPADVARRAYPSPLHACRRDELERLLKFNSIELGDYKIKDELLPMALELQASGNMVVPKDDWRPGSQEKRALVVPERDLSNTRFQDLRSLCRDRGIKFSMTDKKVDLLEKLNGGDTSNIS